MANGPASIQYYNGEVPQNTTKKLGDLDGKFVTFNGDKGYVEEASSASILAQIGSAIHSGTAITIADADQVPLYDASGSILGYITFANLKAALKTYFDTLYAAK